jgi:hypothetical protein
MPLSYKVIGHADRPSDLSGRRYALQSADRNGAS